MSSVTFYPRPHLYPHLQVYPLHATPHVLQSPLRASVPYWQIDAFITRISFIWTTDDSCSSPHPRVMNKMLFSFAFLVSMSGIETAYMRSHTRPGPVTHYWFQVVKDHISLPSYLALRISASHKINPSVLQEVLQEQYNAIWICRTTLWLNSRVLRRTRNLRKSGRLHTIRMPPTGTISLNSVLRLNVYGVFSSFAIDPHRRLV